MKNFLHRINESIDRHFGWFMTNGNKQVRFERMRKSKSPREFTNVLVTGGAGFIGSHLVKYLNKNTDWHITVLDCLTYAGNMENLEGANYDFVKLDIRDKVALKEYFKERKFDAFVHLAAESHVDRSIENPLEFVETNVMGTVNLLEIAVDYHKKNPDFVFYHVSTDEVFGSLELNGCKKFEETTPYDPRSPYSASKASSDHFVRAYHHTYNLPILISNCSNNYGTHQYPEKMIPVTINNLIQRKNIPVYGDGRNVRDWLHVVDHASAIHKILTHGKVGETYCVGGDNDINNITLVMTICEIFDEIYHMKDSIGLISFVKDRKGHDRRYAIKIAKIKSMLGWRPSMSFRDGIEETIRWYVKEYEKGAKKKMKNER